jgi:hypothetical protein
MVRTTVIGLLRRGVTFEDVQGFVDEKLAEKALSGFKILHSKSVTEKGETRLYIKFSKLFEIDKLDHGWNINLSHAFREAGFGDVAWKFTEVDSDDPEGEHTTITIPQGLFAGYLDGADGTEGGKASPEPFGSDDFWQWFDEREQ